MSELPSELENSSRNDLPGNSNAEHKIRKKVISKTEAKAKCLASLINLEAGDLGEDAVQFDFRAAFSALCIHLTHRWLGPLAIPFLIKCFGKHFVLNLNLRPNIVYFLADLQPTVLLGMSVYMWVARPETLLPLIPVMLATFTIILIRDVLVSLKYGYYSPTQLEKLRSKTYSFQKNSQKFILVSWVKVPEKVTTEELRSSFTRLKINADVQFLYFKKLSRSIKSAMKEQGIAEALLEENAIPLNAFASLLISKTNDSTKTGEVYAATAAAVVYGLLPMILIFLSFPTDALGPLDYIYIASSSMVAILFTRAFLLFILAGVYDFKRKKLLMAQCTSLLSPADSALFLLDGSKHMLEVRHPQTILAWYNLRRVFLNFGRPFTLRVFLYTSLVFPICGAALLMVFLVVLKVVSVNLVIFFVPGMFLVACTLTILVYMVASAVSLNYYFKIHRDVLVTNMTALLQQNSAVDSTEALRALNEKLKQDEQLDPVKILGIKVDNSLYAKLAALAGSGILAIVRAVSMM